MIADDSTNSESKFESTFDYYCKIYMYLTKKNLTTVFNLGKTIHRAIASHLDDLGLSSVLDNFSGVLARHQVLTFILISAFVCIALPCIAFFVFAAATVIMTFMGFVLIEGTLISIASILLFAFLGSMFLMLVVFGGLALLGYTGFMHFYDQLCPGDPPVFVRKHVHHVR